MISPFKTIDKFIAYQQNLRNKLMAIRIKTSHRKKRKKDLSEDSLIFRSLLYHFYVRRIRYLGL